MSRKIKLAMRLLISGPGTFPGPGQRSNPPDRPRLLIRLADILEKMISPLNSIRSLVEPEAKTSLFIIFLFSLGNSGVYDDITDTANETSSLTASARTSSMAPLTLPEYMLEVVS